MCLRPISRSTRTKRSGIFFPKHIVNEDGTPGPTTAKPGNITAFDYNAYQLTPPKTPYATSCRPRWSAERRRRMPANFYGITTGTSCGSPANIAPRSNRKRPGRDLLPISVDRRNRPDQQDPRQAVSTMAQDATHLPPGSLPAHKAETPYDAYAASPVHRFYPDAAAARL